MKSARSFLLFCVAVTMVLSQGCDGAPELDVRTFQLQHRSGYEAAELINPYVYRDREDAPGAISALSNAITVRETPDNLEKIQRVLEDFDEEIPPVRLRFQLIEADSFQGDDPAIAPVVEELRSLFRFEGYQLLGEAVVTLASGDMGEQDFTQRFLGPEETFTVSATARMGQPGTISLRPIGLWDQWNQELLETSITVGLGQTVVIGGAKATRDGRSFILTVQGVSD